MKKIFIYLLVALSFLQASTEKEILEKIESAIKNNGITPVIEMFIAKEQAEYPKVMNTLDTVTGVFYIKATKAKVYKHMLNPEWRKIVKGKNNISISEVEKYLPELMQQQATNTACSVKLDRLYLKYGVKIVNRYSEQNGTFLFETTVKESNCITKN